MSLETATDFSGSSFCGRMGRRVLRVLGQPSFDQLSFKSPLVADFKRRKLLLSDQAIDSEFVHVEVFGNLLKRKQALRGGDIFLHTFVPWPMTRQGTRHHESPRKDSRIALNNTESEVCG